MKPGVALVGWVAAAGLVGYLIVRDPAARSPHAPPDAGSVAPVPVPSTIDAPIATVVDAMLEAPPLDAVEIDAPPPTPLYTIAEALDDVLASKLTFVGTGEWFGNDSIHACVYRNDRVIAVNVYCTAVETPAFSLVVLSPKRGRVVVYAEAESAISKLARADYNTFRVEAEPPLADDPLVLTTTYADLRAWDERRYHDHDGACWFEGVGKDGCTSELSAQHAAWAEAAAPFVEKPPDSWYRLVKDMHVRAVRDSKK